MQIMSIDIDAIIYVSLQYVRAAGVFLFAWLRHKDLELNEGHLWKRSSGAGALGGHGKHSGDTQRHSGRSCVHIDPKRHP